MSDATPEPPVPAYTYNARGDEPPFVLPNTVELQAGLVYATAFGQEWRLDLFRPRASGRRAARTGTGPGVLYLHGGSGTRQQMWQHAAHMAARGVVGVSAEYAVGPQRPHRPWGALLGLPRAAARWLRTHAAVLGVDPQRVGAVGGSASGRLVALLGSTDAPEGGVSCRAQAVVVIKGGVAPELATPDSAPTLLIHGAADPLAPYAQTVAYQRRLRALGVRCDLHEEPSAVHRFSDRARFYARCLPLMERFLVEVLGEPGSGPAPSCTPP
jgi:acetyl esterase